MSYMPELTRRHRSLREVISLGVHERGVAQVAGKIDESPSRLSESLAGGTGERDDLELYMS